MRRSRRRNSQDDFRRAGASDPSGHFCLSRFVLEGGIPTMTNVGRLSVLQDDPAHDTLGDEHEPKSTP